MAVGALLLKDRFERTRLTKLAFAMMMLSGIGTILVGLFPENTISSMHMLGAFLGLGVGNLSVLMLGLALRPLPAWLRVYTIASGVLSLAAFGLFLAEVHLGIGRGGMERLISYPFTLWMITFGVYMMTAKTKRTNT